MKKLFAVLFGITIATVLSGCGERTQIKLPFGLSEVHYVEMYRYTVPADAEKKIAEEPEDIESIYSLFANQRVKVKTAEDDDTVGGETVSFRFHLMDDTDYEISYHYGGRRNGSLRLLTEEKEFTASVDVGACWDDCDCEASEAEESELPGLQSAKLSDEDESMIDGTELKTGVYTAEGFTSTLNRG